MGRTRHRVLTAAATALVLAGTTLAVVSSPASGKPPITPTRPDYTFSVAVIPDTQNEVMPTSGPRFANRVSWLVSQQRTLDLRYAVQIGDLTNWGHVDPAQFARASADAAPLEAAIPWSVAAGNHDTAAVCAGGSACPGANTSVTVRDVSTFNRWFPPSHFPNLRGTYEPGRSENSYSTFSAGGKEWLVLTLELWPRTAVIDWANRVVSANPTRNVIINTHAYLTSTGSISTSNGGYGANSPKYLFDHLVRVHPNIVMVLSGHVGQAAVRTDTGASGNKIVSFLQCFHSTTNPVRIVQIDTRAGTVTSSVYAPGTRTSYPQFSTSTTGMRFR